MKGLGAGIYEMEGKSQPKESQKPTRKEYIKPFGGEKKKDS